MPVPNYRWFIAMLADGTYRFVTPDAIEAATKYVGDHGGAIYTHAGYMVFADKGWWNWLQRKYLKEHKDVQDGMMPPHIDVPNLECYFAPAALEWLEANEELLKSKGGKYYEFIPRH